MARRASSKGRKYGTSAQKNVRSAMRRAKKGTLKSGKGPARRALHRVEGIDETGGP